MLKKYQTLFLILLAYIAAFAFYPAITSDFINLDDFVMVTENPDITSLSFSNIKNIFSSTHYKLYHPIVTLSYAIEYYFSALDPYLYHVDNILLHILNTLLLFFIIKRLSKSSFVSYFVAILFAIHPVHVEAVAWVSARKDTLYAFFFLLSMLLYMKTYDDKHNISFYILSLIAFVLSCLSKPMAVTLPVVLILTDFYIGKFKLSDIKKYIPFFVVSAVFVFVAVAIHYSPEEKVIATFFVRFTDFLDAHLNSLFYIYKLFVPASLSCLYPQFYDHNTMTPNFVFYSAAILYLLIFISVFSLKINKKLFFGMFFFLVTLLPSSGIMPTGVCPVADRYVYIPCVGLFFIVAELAFYIYKKNESLKYLVTFLSIITFAILFFLTYQRNLVWANNLNLMTQAINYAPESADHAYLLRGTIYKNKEMLDEAEKDFVKSYSINRQNAYTVFHLGHLRQKQKKYDSAKEYYALIPESSVNFISIINNLAILYDDQQETDKAIKLMQDIIDRNTFVIPDYFYNTLAILYLKKNDYEKALKYLDLAIKINAGNSVYYIEKMDILLKMNDFDEFEKTALSGLKNTEYNMTILDILVREYFFKENYDSAKMYSVKSLSLYPNDHFVCFILGNIFAMNGEYTKALSCYTMAILLSRDSGEYYFKRAVVWYMLNKYNLSMKDVQKAEKYNFIVDKEFKQDLDRIK